MLKEITQVYQNFSALLGNQTMTGTNVLTSAVTDIRYKDSVAIECEWTGTPNGTFAIQGSCDYSPSNSAQGTAGPPNTGTWVTLPTTDVNGVALAATGSSGNFLANLNQLAFPYIRVQYTNTSSTGVLTGYIAGKSLG